MRILIATILILLSFSTLALPKDQREFRDYTQEEFANLPGHVQRRLWKELNDEFGGTRGECSHGDEY